MSASRFLKETNEKAVELLMRHCPGAMFLTAEDGAIIFFNEEAARIFEYVDEDLETLNRSQLISDLTGEEWKTDCSVFQAERLIRKRNGELVPCIFLSRQVKDNGNIYCSIIVSPLQTDNSELTGGINAFESLHLLLSNTEDSFILVSPDLRVVMFNDAARKRAANLLGFELHVGMDILQMSNPDRRNMLREIYQDALQGVSRVSEISIDHNDGGKSYFFITYKPALRKDGSTVGVVINITDITSKVLNEARLKQSEDLYRKLFFHNPLPMWTCDPETFRFLDVNDAALRHYGYTSKEFLSLHLNDIIPQEEEGNPAHDMLCRNTESHTLRHKRRDGSILTVETINHTLDINGRKACLMLANDISERKRTEEVIRASNERFILAGRATSDSIYEWDIVSNRMVWTENLKLLFGYDPDELGIDRWYELIHPDDTTNVKHSLEDALHNPGRTHWYGEYRFRNSEGRYLDVTDRGYILRNQEGEAIRMIGAMNDVSATKYQKRVLDLELQVYAKSAIKSSSFTSVLETLFKGIENLHPDMHCSVLLVNNDGTLNPLSAPSLPAEFIDGLRGYRPGPEDGSCGSAIHLKKPVIVPDISNDPLFKNFPGLSENFQLKSCWSLPLLHSEGYAMGTFTIYHKIVKEPSKTEWATVLRFQNLLRILLENHLSYRQLLISNERYDLVSRATHDLIWEWNIEAGRVYRDDNSVREVYGINNPESIATIENWLSHIHPDDRHRVEERVQKIWRSDNDENFTLEYRFRRDDGSYAHIFDRGMLMRTGNDQAKRAIGAAQDISGRKKLEEELLQQELDRQKSVSQVMIDTQESERSEIGKELHDNINQLLTTTKLYVELARSSPALRDELLEKSSRNILHIINEIRKISHALMLPSLTDLGLVDSIADLAESINDTQSLTVQFESNGIQEHLLTANQKLMFYRIIQESLNNIIRHADATLVWIQLDEQEKNIRLSVRDNGKGFDPDQTKKGVGLYNIRNRVYLFNGILEINSTPGKGSELTVVIPVNNSMQK